MTPDDLERLVDAELKRLPVPRAPGTLLPRVLAATIERAPEPWYARPWLAWPRAWQAASAVLLVALGAALAVVAPVVQQAPWPAPAKWAGVLPGAATALLAAMSQAATVVRVLCRMVVEPAAFALMAAAVSLSLACAALRAVLARFALGDGS